MQITVSSKGQIVLPAQIRKKYGLETGAKLVVVDLGEHIALVPALADPIRDARGILGEGPSLADALLEERRRERAREEREHSA